LDRTGRLADEAVLRSLAICRELRSHADDAGVGTLVAIGTQALREARNAADFIGPASEILRTPIEVISGEREAALAFRAVADTLPALAGAPFTVIDIGGGSTEFIYGNPAGRVDFRHSYDVGSVRLTERLIRTDPLTAEERGRVEKLLRETFSAMPPPPPTAELVGVAGTVTTLYALQNRIEPYDAERVHGGTLTRMQLEQLVDKLCGLPLAERRTLPGLQPKRADVIPAGAMILLEALRALDLHQCRVSDRGLRWGLMAHRFGAPRT
jgi:exopolyphosphatase/guanosine-5'-triphosphate,3'-diphosphate pyrophosphatase